MAYQISEEEYKAIKEKEKQTRDKRISKRLRALMLRYEGKSNPEISAKLDLSTDRLSHLISEYKRYTSFPYPTLYARNEPYRTGLARNTYPWLSK